MTTLGQWGRIGLLMVFSVFILLGISLRAGAAPYAAMVIDARSGEVLHARNADTRLHPASLTKMMTLYVAFEAIERGEISLDTRVKISKKAAAEPPSKLGLKAGQRIQLRYLIRAAAIKSANDAATAIGEAISGSEAAFARRMNRTAKSLGMTKTTFKNAHGLTESGHLSTARDMTKLGRAVFYHYPQYYNLFSRRSADAKLRHVNNTNSRLLNAYKGADGIKTGYTRAAGFNLVASAERGNERIIATVFGGRSTASRNAKVAELLDLGFKRAPRRVATRKPSKPAYQGNDNRRLAAVDQAAPKPGAKGKTIRLIRAPKTSLRPVARPLPETIQTPPELLLAAMEQDIEEVVAKVAVQEPKAAGLKPLPRARAKQPQPELAATAAQRPHRLVVAPKPAKIRKEVQRILFAGGPTSTPRAVPRPSRLIKAAAVKKPKAERQAAKEPVIVSRLSTKGDEGHGISVGLYTSRYKAERVLLKTALSEMETLKGSARKVIKRKQGWDAAFLGMSKAQAARACDRLHARGTACKTLGPS